MDGKIYVINLQGVKVFETKTQMWKPEMIKTDMELGVCFRHVRLDLRVGFGSVLFVSGSIGS